MVLKSSAFKPGGNIPTKFTCDGENVSPLLELREVPTGTKSLALIMDDSDATRGVPWDHWLLWNIEPKTQYISEDAISFGAVQGNSSFNHSRYGGPCPPKGASAHHYNFKLYALDIVLNLPEGSGRGELEKAMEGHILEEAVLVGLYARK